MQKSLYRITAVCLFPACSHRILSSKGLPILCKQKAEPLPGSESEHQMISKWKASTRPIKKKSRSKSKMLGRKKVRIPWKTAIGTANWRVTLSPYCIQGGKLYLFILRLIRKFPLYHILFMELGLGAFAQMNKLYKIGKECWRQATYLCMITVLKKSNKKLWMGRVRGRRL